LHLERKIWQGSRIPHRVVVRNDSDGPGISERLVGMIGLPVRIRWLTVATQIKCRRERGQIPDILVPPNRPNPHYWSLADPHNDRCTVCVLLSSAVAATSAFACSSSAR